MLPESERPRVVGLGPTHRRSGRCAAPAWMHRHWRPFCIHAAAAAQRRNAGFQQHAVPVDESSMVGNTDMARAYALIAPVVVVPWPAVIRTSCRPSRPSALPSPADAQCCRCGHHEGVVRQTPELREAVYSLINRDVKGHCPGLRV